MDLSTNADQADSGISDWIWFVPKWPLPANDGARQATTSLLRHLTALGQSIHLVALVPQGDRIDVEQAISELGVSRVSLLIRAQHQGTVDYLRSALLRPRLPITLAPYAGSSITAEIDRILVAAPGSPVIFDGLHAGAWFRECDLGNRVVVYRAHNVEADIWMRAAADESNVLRSFALRWQERKVRTMEKLLCQRSNLILPVSDIDGEAFAAIESDAEIHTIPIGMDVPAYQNVPPFSTDCPMLFIGRLDWPPNRDGLKWFLDNVWPGVVESRPAAQLQIIGSGNSAWLEKYAHLPGINFLGRVSTVAPYYHAAAATLVPIFYGSGTRVKAIESSLFGRACISTALGVEGLNLEPGNEYFRCESADDWIECIISLREERVSSVGQAARRLVSRGFEARSVARSMRTAVRLIAA